MGDQLNLPLLANKEWGLNKLDEAMAILTEPRVDMAPVPCLTPGCVYNTRVWADSDADTLHVECRVDLPGVLDVDEWDVENLLIHFTAFSVNMVSMWSWQCRPTSDSSDTRVEVLVDKNGTETLVWDTINEDYGPLKGALSILIKSSRRLEWFSCLAESEARAVEHQTHRAIEALLSRLFRFRN